MYRVLRLAPWLLLLLCMQSYGHHSVGGTYKFNETRSVEGKVLEFIFRNPHSFVQIQAADGSKWLLEWDTAENLRKQGIDKDTLRVGDHVTVTGYPRRRADERMMLIRVLRRQRDGSVWGLSKAR